MRIALITLIFCTCLFAAERALDRATPLYNHTDYSAAIDVLKQATPDTQTLELLGKCFFMQGDFKRASDAFEKASVLDPSSSMIFTWLGRSFGRRAETAFPVQAFVLAQKTREAFEKAVQLDSKNGEALGDLFEFYLQAPSMVGGGLDKARNLLPLVAKVSPVELHFARARMAEEKKQFDEAESEYRAAFEMSAHQIARTLDVARFYAKRGRYEESDRLFDQAEKASPDSPQVFFVRAQTYVLSQRKLDQAQALLRKYLSATSLTPDDPPKSEAQKLLKKAQGG